MDGAATILTRLNAVIMQSRPFVNAPTYFSPDRRRKQGSGYRGPLRRRSDASQANDSQVIEL